MSSKTRHTIDTLLTLLRRAYLNTDGNHLGNVLFGPLVQPTTQNALIRIILEAPAALHGAPAPCEEKCTQRSAII